jgi:hypothetical protein
MKEEKRHFNRPFFFSYFFLLTSSMPPGPASAPKPLAGRSLKTE